MLWWWHLSNLSKLETSMKTMIMTSKQCHNPIRTSKKLIQRLYQLNKRNWLKTMIRKLWNNSPNSGKTLSTSIKMTKRCSNHSMWNWTSFQETLLKVNSVFKLLMVKQKILTFNWNNSNRILKPRLLTSTKCSLKNSTSKLQVIISTLKVLTKIPCNRKLIIR